MTYNATTGAVPTAQITYTANNTNPIVNLTAIASTGVTYVPVITSNSGTSIGVNMPYIVFNYNVCGSIRYNSFVVGGIFSSSINTFARGINLYADRSISYTGMYISVTDYDTGANLYQSNYFNIPTTSQRNQPYYVEFNDANSGNNYPILNSAHSILFNVLPISQTQNGWWYDDNGYASDTTFFVCPTNYLTTGTGSTQTITLSPQLTPTIGQSFSINYICVNQPLSQTTYMAIDNTTSAPNTYFTGSGSQSGVSNIVNVIDSAWVNYLNFSRPVQIPNMLGGIPTQSTISVTATDLQHIYKCGWGGLTTPYSGSWVGENVYTFAAYQALTTQTTPPSSNGQIVWNNAAQNVATIIYVSTTDNLSINNTTNLLKCKTGDILYLKDSSGIYQEFQLTSAPINNTTYITYNVFNSVYSGVPFTNGAALTFSIFEFNAYQSTPIAIGANGYYILSRDTTISNGSIYLQSAIPQSIAAYYYTPQVINTAIRFSTQVQFSLTNSIVGFQSNLISLLTQNSTITLVKSISNPTYWILTAYTGNIGFSSI